MPINRNFIFVILLSFLSCDFSSLEKAKEVAGKVRSILESGEDVEVSGYADLAVTREEIDGVEVAVLSGNAGIGVSSPSDSVDVAVEGAGYVNAAGKVSGHTVVSSKIETETGATGTTVYSSNSYSPVGGVSGSNGVTEVTEDTSPSGAISGSSNGNRKGLSGESYLSGFSASSTYSGEFGGASSIVEYYSSGGEYGGKAAIVKGAYGHGIYLKEAKESVKESLGLVKKMLKDYDSFSSYQTTKHSTRFGPKKKEEAAKKAAEYTNERLNQDLDDLLGSVERCLNSTIAATSGEGGFKSDLRAKEQLSKLKEEVEKFVKEVKAGQGAYGTLSGARQGDLLKMKESLSKVKKLLYKINKDTNLDD
ncbi:hypothetical protein [Borrelia sp. RT1S]|uniref:hypothetical protein n=1 Tax=Borrelia sp. RT1S TaxID=2898580 RepID=UPI001E4B356B|nr:hypothetical protein [Borrelia sp. RT1S]UGQ18008.1 hypothetical protein LSO05_06125 [Borrelia sp. RT1S]